MHFEASWLLVSVLVITLLSSVVHCYLYPVPVVMVTRALHMLVAS